MPTSLTLQKVFNENQADFKLRPISKEPPLFKYKYLKKELDPRHPNPIGLDDYRTVTVTCLMPNCR